MSEFSFYVHQYMKGVRSSNTTSVVKMVSEDGYDVSVFFQLRSGHYGKQFQYHQFLPKYAIVKYKGYEYHIEVLKSDYDSHLSSYGGNYHAGRVYQIGEYTKKGEPKRKEMDEYEGKSLVAKMFYETEVKYPGV